jgi:DNA invertase Pin-like site-specific DNA recombinase
MANNYTFPIGEYGAYLRKSRKDAEAESHGEGETLKRHEDILTKLASSYGLSIPEEYIFREVVSGETIEARPEMQRLLALVNEGKLKGVLVIEVERLARGDTSDQGVVAKTFKFNSTLIITPSKVFNPDDEADEEYFEFGLFMSRREYKTITRRLQTGRLKAASEGLYLASVPPYGYEKIKISNNKGYTLNPIPDQANVVKTIYDLYLSGIPTDNGVITRLGPTKIANRLNELGIKPLISSEWTKSSISDILRNPVYAGKLRWGYKKENKYLVNGQVKKHRKKGDRHSYVDGVHPAIIPLEMYEAAQNIMKTRSHASVPSSTTLMNPLAGLVYCGKCERMMTRLSKNNKTPYDTLKCMNTKCDNVSSPLYLVEDVILQSMKVWLGEFKTNWNIEKIDNPYSDLLVTTQTAIDQIQSDINKLSVQRDRLHDLLEQGIYSPDIYVQRNRKLTAELESLEKLMNKNKCELDHLRSQASYNDIYIPKAEFLLSEYNNMESATMKNDALKELIDRITYTKNEPNKKGNRDNKNFEILIDPKIVRF